MSTPTRDAVRRITVEHKNDRIRHKSAKWNHQAELDKLRSRKVDISLINGGTHQGILIEADQYTIKI